MMLCSLNTVKKSPSMIWMPSLRDGEPDRVTIRGGSEAPTTQGDEEFGEEHLERYQAYLRDHPGDEDGAWKYARERPVRNGRPRRS